MKLLHSCCYSSRNGYYKYAAAAPALGRCIAIAVVQGGDVIEVVCFNYYDAPRRRAPAAK